MRNIIRFIGYLFEISKGKFLALATVVDDWIGGGKGAKIG
jgi:hypothetical protein